MSEKQEPYDLGFDLDAAIEALKAAAARLKVFDVGDPRAGDASAIAEAHIHHDGPGRCVESPCPRAGVCHALAEILQYKRESERLVTLARVADLSHQARTWLDGTGHAYGQALAELLESVAAAPADTPPLSPNSELVSERPARILDSLTAFLSETEGYEDALRDLFWSPELRQVGRNKRSQLLLTATWQHLAWGGFSNPEILALVPPTTAGGRALILDRIRKRIDEPNARSVMPVELHPDLGVRVRRSRSEKPAPRNRRQRSRR
ncbi:MAG TPA: hypothetical protein VHB79_30955 [Polyangiaceae bacterium]|nr:hypothetical protein [Polyangiaceae bacterium]